MLRLIIIMNGKTILQVINGKGLTSLPVIQSFRGLKRLTSITSFGKRFQTLIKPNISYITPFMTTEEPINTLELLPSKENPRRETCGQFKNIYLNFHHYN